MKTQSKASFHIALLLSATCAAILAVPVLAEVLR